MGILGSHYAFFYLFGGKHMIRLDDLFVHGWKIYQDTEGFCFGTDAVLLSSFAAEKKFETAVDLCCGTGIIPLLLAANGCAKEVHGVDISAHCIDLAQKSVVLNGLENKVFFHCQDLKETTLSSGKFDLVTANPPYFLPGTGKTSKESVEASRREATCTFFDVVCAASGLLRFGGRFCFVFKPERLAEAMCQCSKVNLEPKVLRLIYPKQTKAPELFLMECKKGAAPGLKCEPPFVLYDSTGAETPQFQAIHRF